MGEYFINFNVFLYQYFINPLAIRVKVLTFKAKHTIISNFFKKKKKQKTKQKQTKQTKKNRWFSFKPFDTVKYHLLFMTTLIVDTSPKYGQIC